MDRRAQGLSMNTIVIAAISLLVLVVVSVIFVQQMGWFSKGTRDCQTVGGVCQEGNCGEGYALHPKGVCLTTDGERDPAYACCTKL